MNKYQLIAAIGFSCLYFSACNQNQSGEETADNKDSIAISSVSDEQKIVFKDDLIDSAFENYIILKNALVASDVQLARKASATLRGSLDQIKGCQNTADIAARISKSTAIEQQRKDFTALSDDLIALIKHADVQEGTTYVQYCPMANSGKGGYWMASSKQIRNPYYGDEMLNCGEVKEEISKK
jgi:hypothetical protein